MNKRKKYLLIYYLVNFCCVIHRRYPEKVHKLVSFAGQSYISKEDMAKMEKVADVSNWSNRMRDPMEAMYGKVSKVKHCLSNLEHIIELSSQNTPR